MNYRSKHRFVREFKEGDIYFNDFTSLDMTHRNDELFDIKMMNMEKLARCSNDIVMSITELRGFAYHVLESQHGTNKEQDFSSETSETKFTSITKVESLNHAFATIILTNTENEGIKEFVILKSSFRDFMKLLSAACITSITLDRVSAFTKKCDLCDSSELICDDCRTRGE